MRRRSRRLLERAAELNLRKAGQRRELAQSHGFLVVFLQEIHHEPQLAIGQSGPLPAFRFLDVEELCDQGHRKTVAVKAVLRIRVHAFRGDELADGEQVLVLEQQPEFVEALVVEGGAELPTQGFDIEMQIEMTHVGDAVRTAAEKLSGGDIRDRRRKDALRRRGIQIEGAVAAQLEGHEQARIGRFILAFRVLAARLPDVRDDAVPRAVEGRNDRDPFKAALHSGMKGHGSPSPSAASGKQNVAIIYTTYVRNINGRNVVPVLRR